jgi:hypothetical protein
MCLPAAPLALAAAGVSAVGSMVSGYGAMQQGRYESKVAKQNAELSMEAAQDSILRGSGERRNFFRQVGQAKGDQVAAMAANGIDPDYGSALRVQQDTATLSREDEQNLYSNIEERTRGEQINAMNLVSEAKAAKYRGKQAMIGSVMEAASSLAGGFSQMRELRLKQPKPKT